MNSFLYKKQVDWSLLKEGLTLPLSLHPFLRKRGYLQLGLGEKRDIVIVINGKEYKAELRNLGINREKYPDHKELIQIRYNPNSEIAEFFRTIYVHSYKEIVAQKAIAGKRIVVSCDPPEFFCLYTTDTPNVFWGETITANDVVEESTAVHLFSELEWENIVNSIDTKAGIQQKEKIVKIRRLDRSIADSLKAVYNYRCQICGCSFRLPYGSMLIHAHHIVPFTESMNNNPENIMILCPNHHGIIHDVHPIFDVKKKVLRYQNGFEEPLKINLHL